MQANGSNCKQMDANEGDTDTVSDTEYEKEYKPVPHCAPGHGSTNAPNQFLQKPLTKPIL